MSTKVQDEWRKYRDQMYPKGMSAIQNKECHQAFFAGAAIALEQCNGIANLPDDQAVEQLKALFDGVMARLESFIPKEPIRNN